MAEATGNMTLRPNSIVHEVMYDPETKKASGVRVIDAETKETIEFKAKLYSYVRQQWHQQPY